MTSPHNIRVCANRLFSSAPWRMTCLILFWTCCGLLGPAWLCAQPLPPDFMATILDDTARITSPGERIVAISSHFVGAPYRANTLIGSPDQAEQLVTRLDGFDCFTLLDTVEALRRSRHPADFPAQLQTVRYREGRLDYRARRHFFSDWVADHHPIAHDMTAAIGEGRALQITKQLNQKADGSLWLPGIAVTPRSISYIPSALFDNRMLALLQPGDYVGFYSDQAGLDVHHTGLIVVAGEVIMLRHASSRSGMERIVDEPLLTYLRGQPGLIVYRVTQ